MTFAGPAPSVPDTPPAAERIRSTCARAGGALLAVEQVQPVTTPLHHLMADGSFAVAIPVDGAAAATVGAQGPAGAQAVLELADYAPLPLREPVRSLVWIRGSLHAVPLPAVPAILDLLAAEEPNPALLQVKTARVAAARRRRHAVHAAAARDRFRGGHRRRRGRVGRGRGPARRGARPVLRDGVLLAAPSRPRPSRRGRAVGRPAAGTAAARADPPAGSRPVRRVAAGGTRRR